MIALPTPRPLPDLASLPVAPKGQLPITDAQVRQFVEQGYLVVENLVSAAELAALEADTLALARGTYPCPSLQPVDASLSDQAVLEGLLCIHQPHYVSPVIRQFVAHAGISAVLGRIVGAHLPFWDGAVKCMQSMLFVKPPGKQGQAWHQDEIYIPTRDRSLCGAWIAIDDATRQNGCLSVLPGSHRTGYLYPFRDHHNLREFDGPQEMHGFDEQGETLVECPRGSVVFFNGYLLHRSRKNRSRTYRRALVNHYMNAWSLLPWCIEGRIAKNETYVAKADNRAVVPVHGVDPYADHGYEQPDGNVWLRGYDRELAREDAPDASGSPTR